MVATGRSGPWSKEYEEQDQEEREQENGSSAAPGSRGNAAHRTVLDGADWADGDYPHRRQFSAVPSGDQKLRTSHSCRLHRLSAG
jgi:hypothetical protein